MASALRKRRVVTQPKPNENGGVFWGRATSKESLAEQTKKGEVEMERGKKK